MKFVPLLYTNNETYERDTKKTLPFIITSNHKILRNKVNEE